MSVPEALPHNPESPYTREYGTHSYTTLDGFSVLGVSEPTFADFATRLEDYTGDHDIILSPELITVDSIPIPGELDKGEQNELKPYRVYHKNILAC